VARRIFEMFHYRQVLVRMRQRDPDRAIARSGLMGRRKLAAFRDLCEREGWLDPAVTRGPAKGTTVPPREFRGTSCDLLGFTVLSACNGRSTQFCYPK
jgi:hypothetical protein